MLIIGTPPRDLRPGLVTWLGRLTSYLGLHGLKFSRREHVELVQVCWGLVTTPGLEPGLLQATARVLVMLLRRQRLLTPGDLGRLHYPLST